MTKGRSPNYPSVTLAEAIDRIRLVYKKEHTHKADKHVVAADLGYTGLNGKSLTLIASLKRYGLLDAEGDGLNVSESAVTILELAENDPVRVEAVVDAAFRPPLFSELNETFGNSLPSDDNLRHYLIRKAFMPKAAAEVIRIYRDNLELVSSLQKAYNPPKAANNEPSKPPPSKVPSIFDGIFESPLLREDAPPARRSEANKQVLSFNISRSSTAQVHFDGRITQEAIDKLVAHLNLSKDTYPSEAELIDESEAEYDPTTGEEPGRMN